MSTLRLALRMLLRDWRAGELRLLALALVLSVTAITGVAWLADRVAGATESRASELLGGDRALVSDRPIDEVHALRALEQGLSVSRTLEFASVILVGDRTQLAALKAVGEGYPLRGQLQVGDDPDAKPETATTIPPRGEVWVEPRLLMQLGIAVGDTVELGARQFIVGRVLLLEPDRGRGFQSLAPRVMFNLDDVAATGLVQDASRVTHRLLVAGESPDVEAWQSTVQADRAESVRLESPGEGQPAVQRAMDTAKRFLGLSALLTVVVGGVAMLLTIRRYAARHLDRVAIMRCLGATQAGIAFLFTTKMILLGLATALIGTVLGYLVHLVMLALLADFLPSLPSPGWRPAVTGIGVAQVILLGFALPTVLRLRKVPPLRVLRRDLGGGVLKGVGVYLVALAAIFLLMWWQAGDLRLAVYVFVAVTGTLSLLGLGAALVVGILRRGWRAGGGSGVLVSAIGRRPWTTGVQIVALGLGLMALLLLSLVRDDLLQTWQDGVPDDAANYFLINIQPDEVDDVADMLAEAGVDTEVRPMVRGRLVAIDGNAVDAGAYEDPRARRAVSREFNLSWLERLPADNSVVEGRFWKGGDTVDPQLSIEREFAERIGVALGDTLRFRFGGDYYEAPVTSLREVKWDSFNVNFFVLASPGFLEDAPATYLTSFYLPEDSQVLLPRLVRAFPSVTLIDITSILEAVRSIMDQGVRVVELMALLTLVSGLVVLLAALQVTREERRFESALLRALGGSRGLIRRLALTEFLLLGGAAGVLAGAGAAVAGYWMARSLFDLDYGINPLLPVAGLLAGVLVVTVAGAAATRGLYRVSPMRLLKSSEEG